MALDHRDPAFGDLRRGRGFGQKRQAEARQQVGEQFLMRGAFGQHRHMARLKPALHRLHHLGPAAGEIRHAGRVFGERLHLPVQRETAPGGGEKRVIGLHDHDETIDRTAKGGAQRLGPGPRGRVETPAQKPGHAARQIVFADKIAPGAGIAVGQRAADGGDMVADVAELVARFGEGAVEAAAFGPAPARIGHVEPGGVQRLAIKAQHRLEFICPGAMHPGMNYNLGVAREHRLAFPR